MRKTISISLAGLLFTLEEDAYKALDVYLKSIQTYFAQHEDGPEITDDIETQIAEEFTLILKGKRKVITYKDVEQLMARLGAVEDFAEFDETEPAEPMATAPSKRFYRNPDDQIIAGVASGIAAYFGIDPTITRVIFFLLIFANGLGFLLYIVLWIILPEAKTAGQRAELHGGQVTLASLKEQLDEKFPEEKRTNAFNQAIRVPGQLLRGLLKVLASVFKFLVGIIGRLAGVLLIVAGLAGFAAAVTVLVTTVIQPFESPLAPIIAAVEPLLLGVILLSVLTAVAVPLCLLILLGVSLLRQRSAVSVPTFLAFFVIWLAAFMGLAISVQLAEPTVRPVLRDLEEQYKQTVTRSLELEDFIGLRLSGNTRVTLTQGDTPSATITGPVARLDALTPQVDDGVLSFNYQGNTTNDLWGEIFGYVPVELELTVPTLTLLRINSNVRAEITDLTTEELEVIASDNARLNANLEVNTIHLKQSGNAWVNLHGSGSALTLELSHNSRLQAGDFIVQQAASDMHHNARAELHVAAALTGTAYHTSRLVYLGQPTVVQVTTEHNARVEEQ